MCHVLWNNILVACGVKNYCGLIILLLGQRVLLAVTSEIEE